jgi:Big-like domain-containing protein
MSPTRARFRPSRIAAVVLTVGAGCLYSAATFDVASAAAADYTWTGAAPVASWSAGANWAGGSPPAGATGTLAFPALTGASCAPTHSAACYASANDTDGLAATSLSIDDGAGYALTGVGLTLGSGGILAVPSAADTAAAAQPDGVALPLALSAPQTWSVTAQAAGQGLVLSGNVTGALSDPLGVQLNGDAVLSLRHAEVGPVTVVGDGTIGDGFLRLGDLDPSTAAPTAGSLNQDDGEPVRVASGASILGLDGTIGPVSTAGGAIQVGEPDHVGSLAVDGDLALDAQGALVTFVTQGGTTAGTDYSVLSVEGSVDLGAATLIVDDGEIPGSSACASLTPGDVDTLITAAGGLTGTFKGVADGAVVTLGCPGSGGTPPTATIHYTSTTITATIATAGLPGTTTATSLMAAPSAPVTNQAVALTAIVSSAASPPTGTVAFDQGGSAIAGCGAEPVTVVNGYYAATCQTRFSATQTVDLGAAFTPAAGATVAASASPVVAVAVAKAPTTTALALSVLSAPSGRPTTYTATVTPAQAGAALPGGVVDFLDDGQPVAGCSGIRVQASGSSSSAACQEAFMAGRVTSLQAITARYDGDPNFNGSTAPPRTLTIPGAPPSAPVPPNKTAVAVARAAVGHASVTATMLDTVITCAGPRGQSCAVVLEVTAHETLRGGKLVATGAAEARGQTRTRTVVVGVRSVKLAVGVGETVHVRLNAAGRRALAALRRLPVTLTATQRTSTGSFAPSTQRAIFRSSS